MNSNYDLQFIAYLVCGEFSKEISFDPYNDCTDMDSLADYCKSQVSKEKEYKKEAKKGEEVSIEITEYDRIHEDYQNEKSCWTFAQAFAENDVDIDIIHAALQCDVNPSDIEEAYSGEFSSDVDFAWDMAENIGAIDKNAKWPNDCIDWNKAASELMYDYVSHNGYYFRSM